MVFYLIGLGLGDVEDITVRGLNIVKRCARVYLESYTSILSHGLDTKRLEEYYGRPVIEADRDLVEQGSDVLLAGCRDEDVCLLVVGDPFSATTHSDLVLRAKELGVQMRIVHNASILNAVGCCGLQLYNFGETVSIVLWTENWQPDSYYDKIIGNRERGLHTLCLLDIKTKERSIENLLKDRPIFEPPRYMTCAEAAKQLLAIVERRKECGETPGFDADSPCVGLARIGWDNEKIVFSTLAEMCTIEMGDPLHSLIIPGQLHPMELDMLKMFAVVGK